MAIQGSEESRSGVREACNIANGAFVEGRLDNLGFKHKQLYALFDCLKVYGVKLLESAPGMQPSLVLELETTLRSISAALDGLPKRRSRVFRDHQRLADTRRNSGVRRRAMGVVMLVADEAHPIASWAIPLAQAIVDGNACLILAVQGSALVPGLLEKRIDSDSYHVLTVEPKDMRTILSAPPKGVVVLVVPRHVLPPGVTPTNGDHRFHFRPITSNPVPIIIDQSVLPRGRPLSPELEAEDHVPSSVTTIAQTVASAFGLRHGEAQPLGNPIYLLVHENVMQPLLRALKVYLPTSTEAVALPLLENKQKIRTFLGGLEGRSKPSFLPIYSVRSIDMAIDFLLQDMTPPSAYVFSSPKFGAYTFNSLLPLELLYINHIPRDALALGPYANRASLSFTVKSKVASVARYDPGMANLFESSVDKVKTVMAWQDVQATGHRIDFFGGSFLFAACLTLSTLLGGVGYGMFRGGVKLISAWNAS